MSTTVHVSMAAAGGDDIENAWAVHRAAGMCRYESWNQCASDINFEQLTRKEKLFFLRCWKFAVENGSFMRIFGGYETMFDNLCDPTSAALALKPEIGKRLEDGELLPVLIEAYAEAKHDGAVNWEAAASLNVENEELKLRVAELEKKHRQRDRNDFINSIMHPNSLYTSDEAEEAIAEYDRKHGASHD